MIQYLSWEQLSKEDQTDFILTMYEIMEEWEWIYGQFEVTKDNILLIENGWH